MYDNYPPGAANDSDAPYNEPIYPKKTIKVEVSASIGTMVEVDIEGWYDEDGFNYNEDDLHDLVKEQIIKEFKVDDDKRILNDIEIWDSQIL